MDITDWRKKIDEIDKKLVELIGERARAAREIGKLKQDTRLPIYEPDREKEVFDNVVSANRGPLPNRDLLHIYERLMDVMRKFQRDEAAPASSPGRDTELEADTND
ncbi:MAG TPA: chorismate mutase [Terriglobales bacterium]|nr:chorismate mutase [Terriglobales bacterium]